MASPYFTNLWLAHTLSSQIIKDISHQEVASRMYERVSHDFSKQNTILYKYWMHVLASLSLLYTKGEVLPLYLNLVMCVCVCVCTHSSLGLT